MADLSYLDFTDELQAQYTLFADQPTVIVAKENISFTAIGFDSTNIKIIFKIGNPNKSFIPDRLINPILGFELNNAYYVIPKMNVDTSGSTIPPN